MLGLLYSKLELSELILRMGEVADLPLAKLTMLAQLSLVKWVLIGHIVPVYLLAVNYGKMVELVKLLCRVESDFLASLPVSGKLTPNLLLTQRLFAISVILVHDFIQSIFCEFFEPAAHLLIKFVLDRTSGRVAQAFIVVRQASDRHYLR